MGTTANCGQIVKLYFQHIRAFLFMVCEFVMCLLANFQHAVMCLFVMNGFRLAIIPEGLIDGVLL